jgi:hypothetical protein
MSGNIGFTIKNDDRILNFDITNFPNKGIFINRESFMSASADEILLLQDFITKHGEAVYAEIDIDDCLLGGEPYDDFEQIKRYVSKERLQAYINHSNSHGYKKTLAIAILDGENPFPITKSKWETSAENKGFVYLLWAENGLHKIGKAKSIDDRVHNLGIKIPIKTKLIHAFKTEDRNKAEADLHQRYAEKREHGEWFDLNEQDIAEITAIKDFDS